MEKKFNSLEDLARIQFESLEPDPEPIDIKGTTFIKQNLEAHVDLCSERYTRLHDRLSAIEVRLAKMNEDMTTGHKSHSKTLIATAGTVIAGLLSTVVVVLMNVN